MAERTSAWAQPANRYQDRHAVSRFSSQAGTQARPTVHPYRPQDGGLSSITRSAPERPPDPGNSRLVQPGRLRHRPGRPMRIPFGGSASSVFTMTSSTCSSVIFRSCPALITEPLQPTGQEPAGPFRHHVPRYTQLRRQVMPIALALSSAGIPLLHATSRRADESLPYRPEQPVLRS